MYYFLKFYAFVKEKWVKVGNHWFVGRYIYSIDEKNRLNIPSKFRKKISRSENETLFLTTGDDPCITVYTVDTLGKKYEELTKLNKYSSEYRSYARRIASNAVDVALDAQGRIVIPQHLKEYANLDKRIAVVGVFEQIEIWDEETYMRHMEEANKDKNRILKKLEHHGNIS